MRRLLLASAVVVIAGAWFLATIRERDVPLEPATRLPQVPELDEQLTSSDSNAEPRWSTREETDPPLIRGRVSELGGNAVYGAELSITPLPERPAWGVRREAPETLARTRSDGRGRFSFDGLDTNAWPSLAVIWATADGFVAASQRIPPRDLDDLMPIEVVLMRGAAAEVHVVNVLGESVGPATVEHVGIEVPGAWSDRESHLAFEAFRRIYRTDGSGRVDISPLRGRQAFIARAGSVESEPVIVDDAAGKTVELVLRSVFRVQGSAEFVSGESDGTELCLDVVAIHAPYDRKLYSTTIELSKTFGPFEVPVPETGEVGFVVRGGGALVERIERTNVASGTSETLRFELRSTPSIVVSDLDGDSKEPIAGASVRISSFESPRDWRHQVERTGPDGRASIPVGRETFYLASWADGYTRFNSERLDNAEWPDDAPVEIELQRGGRLRGHVRHAGHPVEEFEVVVWRGNPHPFSAHHFHGSRDGSFEIDGVPLGDAVHVYASTRELPRCEPVVVDIGADSIAEVELELPDPIVGRGRVVDAGTGRPVPDATIQLWTNWDRYLMTRRGRAHRVANDGTFEISGFGPGNLRYVVEAPAYSTWTGRAHAEPGMDLNLGTIAIVGRQDLHVELVALVRDFSQHIIEVRGPEMAPVVGLDSNGSAVVPALAPASWQATIRARDGQFLVSSLALLPGRHWHLRVPLHSTKLRVSIESESGGPAPEGTNVFLMMTTSEGVFVEAFAPMDDSIATFDHLTGEGGIVEARDSSGAVLVAERVHWSGSDTDVTLRIGGDARRFRVVDMDDRPIAHANLTILCPDEPSWIGVGKCDGSGEVSLRLPNLDRLLAKASHPEHGTAISVPMALDAHPVETTIVRLDVRASVRARVVDGTMPLANVRLLLRDPLGRQVRFELVSDDSGRFEYSRVNESDWVLEPTHPGLWPVLHFVRSTIDGAAVDLQVRRLGNLRVRVRDGALARVPGALVELRSVEFGETLSEWVSAGRVRLARPAAMTDADGRIEIDGLPRGVYEWSVGAAGGSVEVTAGATAELDVVLPE